MDAHLLTGKGGATQVGAASNVVDFVQMVSCRDKLAAWRLLTRAFHSQINADRSIFWLVNAKTPKSLVLGVEHPTTLPSHLQDEDAKELLAYARSSQSLVITTSAFRQKSHKTIVDSLTSTLFENRAYSTLWVLFKDHHANLLGILVLAKCLQPGLERLDDDQTWIYQSKLPCYGDKEKAIAEQLSQSASPVLDLLRSLKLLREMRKSINECTSEQEILDATIETARILLRAKGRHLKPEEGDEVKSSQSHQGFNDPLRVQVCWGDEPKPIAVLELWNPLSDRGQRPFDDRDSDLLEWVARHAASDCHLVGKKLHLESWQADLTTRDDPAEIAECLVERLLDRMNADEKTGGGVVYRAFPRTDRLFSFAAKSKSRDVRRDPYVYHIYEDQSAAIHAFKDEAFHCDPTDPRVNPDGSEAFNIHGSVFALPLGEVGDACFGSVVVWYSQKSLDETSRSALLPALEEIVGYAVSPLRAALFSQTEAYRRNFHERVAHILQQLMGGCDLSATLDHVLEAIQACGFTRVRLYDFRFGDTLVGRSALGMGERKTLFELGPNQYTIKIEDNEYTTQMYDRFCRARDWSRTPAIADGAKNFLLARMCPVKFEGRNVADTMALTMGKPPGMPWAEVPIVAGGKLYGVIAADKLQASSDAADDARWGEITDVDLDAIDVFAQLASRAFAMNDQRGTLVQEHLATLNSILALPEEAADPQDGEVELAMRRMLLFVTHGEEGLGFCRALMYVPNGDDQEQGYHFLCGVGAAEKEAFEDRSRAARHKSLKEVLLEASLEHDVDLSARFANSKLAAIPAGLFPKSSSEVHWVRAPGDLCPSVFTELKALLGANEFMVARMQTASHDLGLLVADRTWIPKPGLISTDAEALAAFARHAAQILLQYKELNRRYTDLENFAEGILHEFRQPLDQIQKSVRAILNTTVGELPATINGWHDSLDAFSRLLESLDKVFSRKYQRSTLTFKQVFQKIAESGLKLLPNHITFEMCTSIPEGLKLTVHAEALVLASDNLFRNAVEALDSGSKDFNGSKSITLGAEVLEKERKVRIFVQDNGPGVRALQRRSRIPKSTKGDGHGWGLFGCKWIARKHGGQLELESVEGESFTASIVLPLEESTS